MFFDGEFEYFLTNFKHAIKEKNYEKNTNKNIFIRRGNAKKMV